MEELDQPHLALLVAAQAHTPLAALVAARNARSANIKILVAKQGALAALPVSSKAQPDKRVVAPVLLDNTIREAQGHVHR